MSNRFTPIRTVAKLDYYGQPYEATVVGHPRRNLAELWEKFKAMQQPVKNDTGQHGEISSEWVEKESEKQLHEYDR